MWLWQDWPGHDGKPDTGIDLVARERHGGCWCAIRYKFYAPTSMIQNGELDSFFTASGKHPLRRGSWSRRPRWAKNALDAMVGQGVPSNQIPVDEFDQSDIDWSTYSFDKPDEVAPPQKKQLRRHQQEALDALRSGLADHDRRKLVIASGGLRDSARAGP
ncbi:hypothetical protein GSU72_02165 [Rathayibacter sp. VKM Ac-2760]|nr:hypothetical protein GSU72_02165 [Rathayibacter sp. VKM Ac-2760]